MIVYCCQRGCGECAQTEGKSDCCGAPVFKWDTDNGVVVIENEEDTK